MVISMLAKIKDETRYARLLKGSKSIARIMSV